MAAAAAPAIAVVTHQSRPDLERHFDALRAVASALGGPLVLADNASTDGGPEWVAARWGGDPLVRLVRLGSNRGYAAGVNGAFAAAGARDVMLVNPDVALTDPAAVVELAACLAREPSVGVAAPRLVGDRGERQPSARRFPTLLSLLGTLPVAGRLPPARRSHGRYVAPAAAASARTVDWAIGAAMLIRRVAYDAVGGWDERFFLYVEDADFCLRCARAGWETAYLPEVAVHHRYERASARERGSVAGSSVRRHHLAGHARLFARDPMLALGLRREAARELATGNGDE